MQNGIPQSIMNPYMHTHVHISHHMATSYMLPLIARVHPNAATHGSHPMEPIRTPNHCGPSYH
jgi:hypothetical protein